VPYRCNHSKEALKEAEALKDLLKNLAELHPDVLREHGIRPKDYHSAGVFRHALESIRGTFIAQAQAPRERFVAETLARMKAKNLICDFNFIGDAGRVDFKVEVSKGYDVALEVKGGEGNSWNISERPTWAKEYIAWGHLDGSLNAPRDGVHAILVTRVTRDFINYGKKFDAIVFKDQLCGTVGRPCPKYANPLQASSQIAPDIFLLPNAIPSPGATCGPIHDAQTLRFPFLLLDLYGVSKKQREPHLYQVEIDRSITVRGNPYQVKIVHEGVIVDGNNVSAASA